VSLPPSPPGAFVSRSDGEAKTSCLRKPPGHSVGVKNNSPDLGSDY
jgi:hypothetical protein